MPTTEEESAQEEGQSTRQPTRASEWGKNKAKAQGFLVDLPSGESAVVRRTLDLPMLLDTGRIPNPLAGIVRTMMETGATNFPKDQMAGKAIQQFLGLLNDQVCRIMIEPPVSRPRAQEPGEEWESYVEDIKDWIPDEGTVSIFDIEMDDKMFLFAVGQGMATDLSTFREQQEQVVDSVQASENVARTPKPTARTGGGTTKAKGRTKSRS